MSIFWWGWDLFGFGAMTRVYCSFPKSVAAKMQGPVIYLILGRRVKL